jgi:hypothetical protein
LAAGAEGPLQPDDAPLCPQEQRAHGQMEPASRYGGWSRLRCAVVVAEPGSFTVGGNVSASAGALRKCTNTETLSAAGLLGALGDRSMPELSCDASVLDSRASRRLCKATLIVAQISNTVITSAIKAG